MFNPHAEYNHKLVENCFLAGLTLDSIKSILDYNQNSLTSATIITSKPNSSPVSRKATNQTQ